MENQLDEKFVRERMKDATIFWYIRTCEDFGMKWLEYPTIEFFGDSEKAGQATTYTTNGVVTSWTIRLNIDLAMESEENYLEFLEEIIPHEVAHVIARRFFPEFSDKHGVEWQAVMKKMGKKPQPFHNMDVSRVSSRKFEYKCPACGQKYFVTKILHNKIERGSERVCSKDHTTIIFVKNHEEYAGDYTA